MVEQQERRRPRRSRTSRHQIAIREKQLLGLELRKSGLQYAEIAELLGYSTAESAARSVKSLLTETQRESVEEYLDIEARRYDDMLYAVWEKALTGNVQAIDRVLRILAQKASLLGLNAPEQHVVTGVGGSPVQHEVIGRLEKYHDVVREIVESGNIVDGTATTVESSEFNDITEPVDSSRSND